MLHGMKTLLIFILSFFLSNMNTSEKIHFYYILYFFTYKESYEKKIMTI